jgi:uncharacterized DUF497 family protein
VIGGKRFIRPISARFMHAKEIQRFIRQTLEDALKEGRQ